MSKWVVKIGNYEYEAELDQIKQWVVEGRVLPEDMVLRKGLGWKAAIEVPALKEAFEEQRRKPPLQKQQVEEPPPSLYVPGYIQNYNEALTLPTLKSRWLGYTLDTLSYAIFLAPGYLLFRLRVAEALMQDPSLTEDVGLKVPTFLVFLGLIISTSLNIYLTSVYGGSIGKKIVGTVVLDNETKSFLSYGKATVREIIRVFFIIPTIGSYYCALVSFLSIWLVFDSKRQQLYDKIIDANVYDDSVNQ